MTRRYDARGGQRRADALGPNLARAGNPFLRRTRRHHNPLWKCEREPRLAALERHSSFGHRGDSTYAAIGFETQGTRVLAQHRSEGLKGQGRCGDCEIQ